MQNEIWKDVIGYPGYKVSSLGRISGQQVDILAINANSSGYMCANLWKNNKIKRVKVHRIVAQAFILNPENKPQVNHKNGVRSDNCVENLEWLNSSENITHAFKILNRVAGRLGKTGDKCYNAIPVIQFEKTGKIIKEFEAISVASRETGVATGSICVVCKGGRLKTAGGFRWSYKKGEEVCLAK